MKNSNTLRYLIKFAFIFFCSTLVHPICLEYSKKKTYALKISSIYNIFQHFYVQFFFFINVKPVKLTTEWQPLLSSYPPSVTNSRENHLWAFLRSLIPKRCFKCFLYVFTKFFISTLLVPFCLIVSLKKKMGGVFSFFIKNMFLSPWYYHRKACRWRLQRTYVVLAM